MHTRRFLENKSKNIFRSGYVHLKVDMTNYKVIVMTKPEGLTLCVEVDHADNYETTAALYYSEREIRSINPSTCNIVFPDPTYYCSSCDCEDGHWCRDCGDEIDGGVCADNDGYCRNCNGGDAPEPPEDWQTLSTNNQPEGWTT